MVMSATAGSLLIRLSVVRVQIPPKWVSVIGLWRFTVEEWLQNHQWIAICSILLASFFKFWIECNLLARVDYLPKCQ